MKRGGFIRSGMLLLCALLVSGISRADEGMWLPLLVKELNLRDMQAKGFKLSAEDIYSVNSSSLKDAVVRYGRGCTGGVVSAEGLLLTNHHCAYDAIQGPSSVAHDYLTNGYSAGNRSEELPCAGLKVQFLEYMEDVTPLVLHGVKAKSTPEQRASIVSSNVAKLVSQREVKDNTLRYIVEPLFYGNQYYLYAYREYRDVRLVVAPPSAAGKFGGDTDNWMWPRHTSDFTLFRIYAGRDNQPADYSADNVPYRSKRHLKINIQPRREGDFTMVFGFPGTTQRYLISDAVIDVLEHSNPRRISLRTDRLNIMDRYMNENDTIRIQYASKHASVANAWKKWQGEMIGLRRLNAVGLKQQQELDFNRWVSMGPKGRQVEYTNVLRRMSDIYHDLRPLSLSMDYYQNGLRGIESLMFAAQCKMPEQSSPAEGLQRLRERGESFFKNYSPRVERDLMERMLRRYIDEVPLGLQLPCISERFADQEDIANFTEKVMLTSIFTSCKRFSQFLDRLASGESISFENDPLYSLSQSVVSDYRKTVQMPMWELQAKLQPLYRVYVKGLMEKNPEGRFFPDANSTLRVAYGQIEGYQGREAVHYSPFTTLDGMVEKVAAGAHDYVIPARLAELHKSKDYGRWAVDGSVPSCMLASVHTTGGNSGSPTLNASGELIGLNFDRVWEGTMSDIMFDPDKCRNIIVDARYILFMIDKYAGAGYLLNELSLVE